MRKKEQEKNIIEIKEEVQINEDVILEAGDKIEVLDEASEIKNNLKNIISYYLENGFDYKEIGKEIAKEIEWSAETTGNARMIIFGVREYLDNSYP